MTVGQPTRASVSMVAVLLPMFLAVKRETSEQKDDDEEGRRAEAECMIHSCKEADISV